MIDPYCACKCMGGTGLDPWGRSLSRSSEDKTAFFNASTHSILWCPHYLKEVTGLLFPLALGFCGEQNRVEAFISLSSGHFTHGGETGQPGYNLCMCDRPNLVAGPELVLRKEGLVKEDGRSGRIRFQLGPRPQLWLLLLGEQRREANTGASHWWLCWRVDSVLQKPAERGKIATPTPTLTYTLQPGKSQHMFPVSLLAGQGSI